ncbi:MAG: hypothetical protein WC626_07875 [Methanoregula sp.]
MSLKDGKIVIIITLLLLLVVQVQGLAPGRIAVYSTPSGAVACIDTVNCDTTDAFFSVSGNTWHSVVVTNKGYLQWSDTIFVVSDHTSVVNAELQLNPAITVLQVDVTPGSGTVCLDSTQCHQNVGVYGGSGSTQFTSVSPGYHMITVWGPADYEDYYTTVYVDLAKSTYVTVTLKPLNMPVTTVTPVIPPAASETGTVRVYVDQKGSTICIDNTDCRMNVGGAAGMGTGTTLFTNVTTNTLHTISVTAAGFKPYSSLVTVRQDMINTVDVSLQPLTVATTAPAPLPAEPTLMPTKAGLNAAPVLGALVLCGAIFLLWKNDR